MKKKQIHSPPSIRGHWTVSSRHCPMRHCWAAVQSLDSQVRLLQVATDTQHDTHIRSRLVGSSEKSSSRAAKFFLDPAKFSSILPNFSSHQIHPALITVTQSRSEMVQTALCCSDSQLQTSLLSSSAAHISVPKHCITKSAQIRGAGPP